MFDVRTAEDKILAIRLLLADSSFISLIFSSWGITLLNLIWNTQLHHLVGISEVLRLQLFPCTSQLLKKELPIVISTLLNSLCNSFFIRKRVIDSEIMICIYLETGIDTVSKYRYYGDTCINLLIKIKPSAEQIYSYVYQWTTWL